MSSLCVNFWRSYASLWTLRPSIYSPSGSPSACFQHFSHTCLDILSWNFAHDFVLMYYRWNLSVVTLRQFLKELCLFVNLEYMYVQFSALFSYMLWHIELKFCISLCFTVLQIKFECRQFLSIFEGVMPLLECRILKIHSFPALFSYMLWLIELKFCILLCFTVLQIKFECRQIRQFLKELCPFWNVEYWKYTVFRTFSYTLWLIELKFCTWLCFTVLQIKFECRQFASIFVGVMPLFELRILEIHSFRTFPLHALTYWAEILHMTLFYCTTDEVRVLSILRQFLWSYASFGM